MNTPRTDKQAASNIGFYSCATVPADFARELERENAELMAALHALYKQAAKAGDSAAEDAMAQARAAIAKATKTQG